LSVLSGDDIVIAAVCTEPLAGDQRTPLEAAYHKAAGEKPGETPALILACCPLLEAVGLEAVVENLDRVSGGTPVFGHVAIDSSSTFRLNQTIFNGACSRDALAFALVYGDISPQFFVANLSSESVQKQRGIITKSQGNVVMEINKMLPIDYLRKLGLFKDQGSWEMASFPFVLEYNDGTMPVARSIYFLSPEGYAMCAGNMPEGASLAIGDLTRTDVLRTTTETASATVAAEAGDRPVLMYSCSTRYMALGLDSLAELEAVDVCMGSGRPYQIAYAGGEICPVKDAGGKLVNRFHNCSFIACIL
jgi:hypothetical protein